MAYLTCDGSTLHHNAPGCAAGRSLQQQLGEVCSLCRPQLLPQAVWRQQLAAVCPKHGRQLSVQVPERLSCVDRLLNEAAVRKGMAGRGRFARLCEVAAQAAMQPSMPAGLLRSLGYTYEDCLVSRRAHSKHSQPPRLLGPSALLFCSIELRMPTSAGPSASCGRSRATLHTHCMSTEWLVSRTDAGSTAARPTGI